MPGIRWFLHIRSRAVQGLQPCKQARSGQHWLLSDLSGLFQCWLTRSAQFRQPALPLREREREEVWLRFHRVGNTVNTLPVSTGHQTWTLTTITPSRHSLHHNTELASSIIMMSRFKPALSALQLTPLALAGRFYQLFISGQNCRTGRGEETQCGFVNLRLDWLESPLLWWLMAGTQWSVTMPDTSSSIQP